MRLRWIGWFIIVLVLYAGISYAQVRLDNRDYLSLDLGPTFSWHSQARGFYFPYVYEFDSRQPSVAQKFKFVELGSGIGYRAGISVDLGLLGDAAVRFSARYAYHTTSHREQAEYDCSGNLGTLGMTMLETAYKGRWQYAGADMFLRKSLIGEQVYGLIGIGYAHLISDELDGEQSIVSSSNNCEYLWLPSGDKSGNTSVSVQGQTSSNYYADGQYHTKIGIGGLFRLSEDFVISPEIILNIPLNRMLTTAVEEEYDRQPAPTPRLWSTDAVISIRYIIGGPKEKYVMPVELKTVSISKPVAQPEAPEPKGFALTGKVRNSVTQQAIPADIVVTRLDSAAPPIDGRTSVIGLYNISVPTPGTYSVTATARDYLFGSTLFVVHPDGTIASAKHDIALSPEDDGKIRLLIFFDVDKAELEDISYPELDRAALLLKETPNMHAEIAGHTDSTGTLEHNNDLSKRRAESVRTYLIGKGIKPERLTAEGYGAATPVASNASESGRAENRRVEFLVRKRQ